MRDTKYLFNNIGIFVVHTLGGPVSKTWASCSMATKTPSRITVYVPVQWCEIFNHTHEVVKNWLALCNEALGTSITMLDHTVQIPLQNKNNVINTHYPSLVSNFNRFPTDGYVHSRDSGKLHADLDQDEFYQFELTGKTQNQNYVSFIFLRYLYCNHFVQIVDDALEIYPYLELSDNKALSAILMAHLNQDYCLYFGLLTNNIKWESNLIYPKIRAASSTANSSVDIISTIKMEHVSLRLNYIKQLRELVSKKDWKAVEKANYDYLEAIKTVPEKIVERVKRQYIKTSSYWNENIKF